MSRRFQLPLIVILCAASSMAERVAAASPSEACSQFVQQFYDWYLAREKALEDGKSEETILDVALREKQSSFDPGLVKALQEDLAAAKKSPGEVVGVDFDPIQNAQDTPERYLVGEVSLKKDRYWVEVFGMWNGKKNSKPDVVPELALRDGKWVFINFHYGKSDIPVNENLLSVLQALKKERAEPAK